VAAPGHALEVPFVAAATLVLGAAIVGSVALWARVFGFVVGGLWRLGRASQLGSGAVAGGALVLSLFGGLAEWEVGEDVVSQGWVEETETIVAAAPLLWSEPSEVAAIVRSAQGDPRLDGGTQWPLLARVAGAQASGRVRRADQVTQRPLLARVAGSPPVVRGRGALGRAAPLPRDACFEALEGPCASSPCPAERVRRRLVGSRGAGGGLQRADAEDVVSKAMLEVCEGAQAGQTAGHLSRAGSLAPRRSEADL
jgi:hypothetical protein